jgi:hypothetical protein
MEYDPTYNITECTYYYGGGMENSYIRYELTVDENQIATITYTEKKSRPTYSAIPANCFQLHSINLLNRLIPSPVLFLQIYFSK